MSDIFHLFFCSKNDNQANCARYSKRVEQDESTNMIHMIHYKTIKWYLFQFASTMAQNYSPLHSQSLNPLPRQVSLPSFDSWCPKGLEAHAPKLLEDSAKCQRKVFVADLILCLKKRVPFLEMSMSLIGSFFEGDLFSKRVFFVFCF